MNPYDVIIAVFNDHLQVDAAVRKLIDERFDLKQFSVVGKGYHTEEKIVGLYTMGAA
ncbi:general stress protein [Paraburkholderia fungorum]|uniref:general stress protein n=1 Tax=Paraburkholderia fungorum TaxID=134537 RepID=UPI0038BB715C